MNVYLTLSASSFSICRNVEDQIPDTGEEEEEEEEDEDQDI